MGGLEPPPGYATVHCHCLLNLYAKSQQHRGSGLLECRQRGQESKGVVFLTTPGHVVASLNKTFYDDYLCLVALNKQQIYVGRSHRSTGKLGKWSTPKRVRIHPKDSTIVAFS